MSVLVRDGEFQKWIIKRTEREKFRIEMSKAVIQLKILAQGPVLHTSMTSEFMQQFSDVTKRLLQEEVLREGMDDRMVQYNIETGGIAPMLYGKEWRKLILYPRCADPITPDVSDMASLLNDKDSEAMERLWTTTQGINLNELPICLQLCAQVDLHSSTPRTLAEWMQKSQCSRMVVEPVTITKSGADGSILVGYQISLIEW